MTTHKQTMPVAKKQHTCSCCKATIQKGEKYERYELAIFREEDIDYSFNVYKSCQKCINETQKEEEKWEQWFEERRQECAKDGHKFQDQYSLSYDSGGAAFPDVFDGSICINCFQKRD